MTYLRPKTLEQALEYAADPDLTVIAGGTDVFPAAKQGQLPSRLLDVVDIDGLKQIEHGPGGVFFGAAVTWTDVTKADLPRAFDGLKQAAREVGSVQIQNAATVAGNICNASPAADGVPPLLALEAEVEVASAERGRRRVPLSEFIKGVRETVLGRDELVTGIHVPSPPDNAKASFVKLGSRSYLVISIAMVSVLIVVDKVGRIEVARIAVGACSAVARRLAKLEADCIGQQVNEIRVTPEHLSPLSPIDDVRGSAAYRLDAVAELCQRAIREAVQR